MQIASQNYWPYYLASPFRLKFFKSCFPSKLEPSSGGKKFCIEFTTHDNEKCNFFYKLQYNNKAAVAIASTYVSSCYWNFHIL